MIVLVYSLSFQKCCFRDPAKVGSFEFKQVRLGGAIKHPSFIALIVVQCKGNLAQSDFNLTYKMTT